MLATLERDRVPQLQRWSAALDEKNVRRCHVDHRYSVPTVPTLPSRRPCRPRRPREVDEVVPPGVGTVIVRRWSALLPRFWSRRFSMQVEIPVIRSVIPGSGLPSTRSERTIDGSLRSPAAARPRHRCVDRHRTGARAAVREARVRRRDRCRRTGDRADSHRDRHRLRTARDAGAGRPQHLRGGPAPLRRRDGWSPRAGCGRVERRDGVHGRFDTTDLDEDLRLVDLNCRSVVHLAKLAVRDMVARGEGRVLVTASIAAKGPGPSTRPMRRRRRSCTRSPRRSGYELDGTGVTVTS